MRKVEIEEHDRVKPRLTDSLRGCVDEAVTAADGAVDGAEHERVDQDPDDQDRDHRLPHADEV